MLTHAIRARALSNHRSRLVCAYNRMYISCVNFTWDEPKREANLAKHGLDFADAAKVFAGPMVLFEDDRFDYGEQRMIGVGLLDYLVVLIVHVESDETI